MGIATVAAKVCPMRVLKRFEVSIETELSKAMKKPRLLDLFCGAGGAAMGYHRAGFEVVGVDIKPQPNYPFEFHQADALSYAASHAWQFDAIHSSPPCQVHSQLADLARQHTEDYDVKHIDLIPQTRFLLEAFGLPYVIENVPGARRALRNPITLCGNMFGLHVYRHRLFESNVMLMQPNHNKHKKKALPKGYVPRSEDDFVVVTGKVGANLLAQKAMGIDWMSTKRIEDRTSEASQAIPPAYTEWIGRQLMNIVLNMQIEVVG